MAVKREWKRNGERVKEGRQEKTVLNSKSSTDREREISDNHGGTSLLVLPITV